MTIGHVVIVGGGFSGALLAVNLLRHDGPRATLIERGAMAAEGLAYGAAHPTHLLNVRAGNMSAFPDDPEHFVRWLAQRGEAADAQTFVPRLVYGAYLRALLDEALRTCGGRLTIVRGDVVDIARDPAPRAILADGRAIDGDTIVLAVGNLPPHTPAGIALDALAPARYAIDPWADRTTLDGVDNGGGDVLILGTGLTMVDVALRMDAEGFAGRIVAMSRRGLMPRAHADAGQAWTRIAERPRETGSALLRSVRTRAAAIGWRNAVDELRPFTQGLWRNASSADRARFLRHLRPWWDVHRHRIAPPVADRIAAMIASGRLTIVAGKPVRIDEHADGVTIQWRPRGALAAETLRVARIVNCTGPQGDLLRTDDPLLRGLLARGAIRADDCRIGIDVDSRSRAIAADGGADDTLLAIGPMTRGAFWEIVAVPDIRAQVWTLARRLSNAEWVAGEGL